MLISGFFSWHMHQLEATAPCSHASRSEGLRQGWEATLNTFFAADTVAITARCLTGRRKLRGRLFLPVSLQGVPPWPHLTSLWNSIPPYCIFLSTSQRNTALPVHMDWKTKSVQIHSLPTSGAFSPICCLCHKQAHSELGPGTELKKN